MSHLPERLETYLCSFVSQSTKYAFEIETGAPGELLASTLLLWAKSAATENIRCATVNAICGLITANEGARRTFSNHNGLQVVADVLHMSKTENGIGACAQTLTALARFGRDRKLLCCHKYVVPDLVQASKMRSESTSKKCVACLKEIALEYSCHQKLLKNSVVEATSVFLRTRPSDAVVKLILILWHNLSCTKNSWMRFGPHLDILAIYLKHSVAAIQSLSLCILCNLLSHPANCEHFGRQMVFKNVMERSSPLSELGVATKACFVLQNALRFSSNCRKKFADNGGVSMMVKLMLIYEENDIRVSSLTIALMAIQHVPTECFHFLSSVTQMLEILSYDLTTFEVAIRILKLLAFLAKLDDATRQKVAAVNAINAVVQLFEIPEKLGDTVVLKHQKEGDRMLALKLAAAFMSLLSHSKKLLNRLVSHGALAMIVSILAENSISALPEDVLVNSSIFLANVSANRQGMNDIVSTCGIPVILKSAVVIATTISKAQNETISPFRMQKFQTLKGLPLLPKACPDQSTQTLSGSQELMKTGEDCKLKLLIKDVNSSASSKSTQLNNASEQTENRRLPMEIDQLEFMPGRAGVDGSTSIMTTSCAALDVRHAAADVEIPCVKNECDVSKDRILWMAQIGKPVASRTLKSIIKLSVAKFESIECKIRSCLNEMIACVEVNSVKDDEKMNSKGEQSLVENATGAIMFDAIQASDEMRKISMLEKASEQQTQPVASIAPDFASAAIETTDGLCSEDCNSDDVMSKHSSSANENVDWASILDEEDNWETEDAKTWKAILIPEPASLLDDTFAPGTALALLVKCLQNLCAGEPDARKQMLECGASSFLIACLIPITGTKTARSRQLEGIPVAVPHMDDTLGLSVRMDAAGALSNLALSEQTRQNLMATGIFDVLEEVGAWEKIEGTGDRQAGFNGNSGGRLMKEPRELIDRLASLLRTMCGDEKCRRRVRSSSKLQSLASLMPVKLSEHSKYQENGMLFNELICSSSIYKPKFITVDRKLSAEHS